jgi:hypothetical protein
VPYRRYTTFRPALIVPSPLRNCALREDDTIRLMGAVMNAMKAMFVVVGLLLAATPAGAMTGLTSRVIP